MIFGPELSLAIGSAEYALATDGVNVWLAWCASGGVVQVAKSTNQCYDLPTATPVTVNSNAANTDVQLNESFVIDPVTGALHLFWSRNSGSGSNPCALMYSTSTDGGATWSAAATLDNGVANGNNRFHRLGAAAYNGVVQAVYASIDSSAFTTDGLWTVSSTNAGSTWSSPAKLYTTPVEVGEPNAAIGDDGTMHISWYDSGVNNNTGGDLYYAQGVWNAAGFQWQPTVTRVTTGQVCGRSRVATSRGVVMLTANTNWGGAVADVGTVRSADNGKTWGSVVTQATHGAGPLTHPWLDISSDHAALIWYDTSNNPSAGVYGFRLSGDAGATWAAGPTAMATTLATADAPHVLFTNDLAWTFGFDASGNLIFAALPLFSPAVPSAAVLDNFNRANENPLSDSGQWSADTVIAGTPLKLASNVATLQAGGGTFGRSGSFWNAASIAEGEVYLTIANNGGADGEFDFGLVDIATKNGYVVLLKNNLGSTAIFLDILNTGVESNLVNTTAFGAVTGDKYALRLTPNDVILYRFDTSAGDWSELFRVRDTTYRASLSPWVNVIANSGNPTMDDFGGSTLVQPSNTAAPTASGTIGVGNLLTVTEGTWATAQGATPARYSYQWQTSPAGANTWSNVNLAELPFFTVTDATKDHRCVVTASNSYGIAAVDSNVLPGVAGSPAPLMSSAFTPGPKGLPSRIWAKMRMLRPPSRGVVLAPTVRRSGPGYAVTITTSPLTSALASTKLAAANTSAPAKLSEAGPNAAASATATAPTTAKSSVSPTGPGPTTSVYIQ